MRWVGVDGCPAGWYAAVIEDGDGAVWGEVFGDFDALWAAHGDAERVFVDVPIGIPDSGRRACDEAAKRVLGARGSSVFYAPAREVVRVYRSGGDYDEANGTNREVTGNGLSVQAWNIVPKIAELDAFLRADVDDGRVETVLESHPECCFLSLNGQPVAYSKSTEAGLAQRRHLLDRASSRDDPGTEAVYREALERYPRSAVARDDVLDAMALALVASTGPSEYVRLPGGAESGVPMDAGGLPMQIVYGGPRYSALFEPYRDEPV